MSNQALHEETITLAKTYVESERKLIHRLILVEQRKAYRDYKLKGLFRYGTEILKLSPSAAQMFRTVVNHAIRLPELKDALESERISVPYASKIVAQLTPSNVAEILNFAETHSIRETEEMLVKDHGADRSWNLKLTLANRVAFREAKDIEFANLDDNEMFAKIVQFYRERKHPAELAKKAALRKAKAAAQSDAQSAAHSDEKTKVSPQNSEPAPSSWKRKPLSAAQKRSVDERDQHRCTFRHADGKRCKEKRWLHKHHIHLVSEGGGNEAENILTLCAEHHDLVHQMSFPMEDQRGWLESGVPLQ